MPVPTVYSEASFAQYLVDVLDTLAGTLGWDVGDPRVQEAMSDALLEYDEADIANVTGSANLLKLRVLGRRAIWRAVAEATAGNYSFSSDGQRFDRQQVHDHAVAMKEAAEVQMRDYGLDPTYGATITAIYRPLDPYTVLPEESRVP